MGGAGAMSNEFIYWVSFREQPIEGDPRTDFYFYSLAAIYEVFTPAQIGCRVQTLWNAGIDVGGRTTTGSARSGKNPSRESRRNAPLARRKIRSGKLPNWGADAHPR